MTALAPQPAVRPLRLPPAPATTARAFGPLRGLVSGLPASLAVSPHTERPGPDPVTLTLSFGSDALELSLPASVEEALAGPDAPAEPVARLLHLELALDALLGTLEVATGREATLRHGTGSAAAAGPGMALRVRVGDAAGVVHVRGCGPEAARALRDAVTPLLPPPPAPDPPLRAALRLGGMTAPAALLRPGALCLPARGAMPLAAAGLLVAGRTWGSVALQGAAAYVTEIRPMPEDPAPAPPSDPMRALADLPLRLSFEVGARRATLGEVAGWAPGVVLPLEAPVEDCPVEVRAGGDMGGETIARGRLVAVGDRVGVELTEVRHLEPPPGAGRAPDA